MTIASAIILGVIEGLTEFLPVSSTGHLILATRILGIESTDAVKSFDIAIQVGAIAAVAILYRRIFLQSRRSVLLVMTAFIPTAIIGVLLHGFVRSYLLDSVTVVSWSLLLGGLFLIIFERFHRESSSTTDSIEAISVRQAVIIGLFQSVAIIPGVSRAAATVIGGLMLGLKRRTVVEFSFLLAIPTMLAATALDLLKTRSAISGHEALLIAIGGVTSFIVAIIAVRWFLSFIRNHSFTSFGIYRIIVGIVCLLLLR
ncbi:MAG: undecaprenyl-diphosphatase UppP [Candidatus Peribacteraceae bacterium]|nr:undecaprenyl-diphosphatase UppP [Candidatus Peribacteraceae bacterium]